MPGADPDWTFIRQTLALALATERPVALDGAGAFLDANPGYAPLVSDIDMLVSGGAGRLRREGGSLAFDPPALSYGRLSCDAGRFSAAMEIVLFLMPRLFAEPFRSVVSVTGCTHSPLSPSPAALRDGLLPFLEDAGFFCGMLLGRYGFHGSGGGRFEARIYPREKRERAGAGADPAVLAGGRIIAGRVPAEFAARARDILATGAGLDADRVSMLEVLDCDGVGLCAELFMARGNRNVVMSHDASFFDAAGDVSFDEEGLVGGIRGFAARARGIAGSGGLPPFIERELLVYRVLSGGAGGHIPPAYQEHARFFERFS